jgi:hypothetical protein
MTGIAKKSFDTPDERRTPTDTVVDVVDLGEAQVARTTFQPGWRWSEAIKPVAGTDTCQVRHFGAAVSGTIHVSHEDGTELDIGPGDSYVIEPGHDAWVVGDEPFVGFEFSSKAATEYARG